MDFSKPAPQPQSYKGHMAMATVLPDRVVFKRSPLALLGGNRSGEVLLSDVIAVNVTEPTRWLNGHVHLQTAADAGPLRITSRESQQAVAGNRRAVMFTYGQRETFKGFVAAVQQAWEAQRPGR